MNTKKKVFMYVNVDWFFLSHRLPIAKDALKHNVNMTVFADFTRSHDDIDYSGFKLKKSRIKRKNKSLFLGFIATFLQVLREKPDLIHAVTIKPIILLGIIARLNKKPFIGAVSGLGPAFKGNNFLSKIRKKIIINLYKFIFNSKRAHAICQSNHDRDVLIRSGIISEDRISLIHGSGVDLDKFKPIKKIILNPPFVLMASRLLADKGVIEFCKSAHIVKENYCDKIDFKLAGPIDNLSPSALSLQSVKSLCKENRVEYLGNIECINVLLAKADLFVYPSYYPEGIPKVLLEASACGVPTITTDHPGCRDAIINNKTGVLVPTQDINSLANKIISLLNDLDAVRIMGVNARVLAEKSYSVEKVVDKHYRLYKMLMNQSSY